MQAIAHRSRDIGIVDDEQYIRFRKQISSKGWNKNEPLDDRIRPEQPQWLLKCWKLLIEKKIVREAGLEDELGFSLDLVVRLFGESAPQEILPSASAKRIVPFGS